MADDVARAVGTVGAEIVLIAGKQCQTRPLSVNELLEIERECLRQYKRNYLKTFADNADCLPEGEAGRTIAGLMERVARWEVPDLPPRFICNPFYIEVTDKAKKWLQENMSFTPTGEPELQNAQCQRMLAAAIDAGMLGEDQYEQLAGQPLKKQRVGYVNWWMSSTVDGMLTFVWMAFRDNGVTKEEVAKELGNNPEMLRQLTEEIERLTIPKMGNG